MILKLKNVRLAFSQNLFKAGAMQADQEKKYSSTFIVAKDDEQVKQITAVLQAVANDKWGTKAADILKQLKAADKLCLRDGDGKAQYEGFEGNYYIAASSKVAPKVFDRDKSELSEGSGKVYSGCYVACSLDIWAQDNQYGKRINATLRGVQFMNDGDAFSGSGPAKSEEFDDLSDLGTNSDADELGF